MSSGLEAEPVKSAVPVADLTVLDGALGAGGAALADAVRKVRPADVGRDLSRRPVAAGRALVAAMDDRRGAATLVSAHPTVAAGIVGELAPAKAATLLSFMDTDHQVAILGQLAPPSRAQVEAALDPEVSKTVQRLLAHPPSAVGRIMTPKIWKMPREAAAGDAMAALRTNAGHIEVAVNCYVVDGAGKLVGVIPLRELSIAPPAEPLATLMTPDPLSVREHTERGDAAEIIRTHNFLSLPVTDDAGVLVGAVRVDDLLGAALDKVGTGILNQGGVAGKVAGAVPYFQTNIVRVVRSRITWLILLFVAETATGTVLRYFESELAKVVALSFFIPLLIGTGGNAGSQTVSTIIRALALGEVRQRDVWRVAFKELVSGLLLGTLLGGIAFGRALLWGVGAQVAGCVAVTILVVCVWANAVGALIPLLAQRFKIDPTVVSAPLITTLVDASGLFIYFSVAHLMITALQ